MPRLPILLLLLTLGLPALFAGEPPVQTPATPNPAPATPPNPAPATPPIPATPPKPATPPAYEVVVLENNLARAVLATERGALRQFELKTAAPVALPKHLRHVHSPLPKNEANQPNPLPVLGDTGRWRNHAWLTNSDQGATVQNGLGIDDTAPWVIAKRSEESVTFTYSKSSPALVYELTWTLLADRPTLNAMLTVRNASTAPVTFEPALIPLVGVHQDYGPVESYYQVAFVLQAGADQWPVTQMYPAPSNQPPIAFDKRTRGSQTLEFKPDSVMVGLKSRFFAAWFSPYQVGAAPTSAPTATAAATNPAGAGGPSFGDDSAKPAPGVQKVWTSAKVWGTWSADTNEHQACLGVTGPAVTVAPSATFSAPWSITVTSMKSADLGRLTPAERTVEYTDWFHRFFRSLTWLLTAALDLLAWLVVNYGVAVVLLTFLLKLVLFRLTYKQYESMLKMQKLAPEIKLLNETYKNDKQKLATKQMELWQKHKVNPLGGCLPMLIQIPIFIALYQAFCHSADMRGQPFLWISDLTLPDQLIYLGFHFPSWFPLWSNLPASINPLPIIYMGVALWMGLQQKPPEGGDEFQQQMAKTMRWMPVLFGLIFYNMPAGLVLYFTVNSLLSTIEIKIVKNRLGMA